MEEINYVSITMWIEDFWMAFLEKPKFFRWLCKVIMGKYAWRELIGAKKELDKLVDWWDNGYSISDHINYTKENKEFKNW